MKLVIQRVSEAAVKVEGKTTGEIAHGLLVLLGIHQDDNEEDLEWLCNKLVQLRIFRDDNGQMNLSIKDVDGEALVISQFTLHAKTKKGNRPSFIEAAKPELAIPLYEQFVKRLEVLTGKKVATGIFAADMKVSLVNDGPVTITIDSKNRV